MSTGNRCSCTGLSHDPATCETIREFKRREADGSAGANTLRALQFSRGASVQPVPVNTPRLSASYPARETKLEEIIRAAMPVPTPVYPGLPVEAARLVNQINRRLPDHGVKHGVPPHSKCSCVECAKWRLNPANLAVKDQP